MAIESSVIFPKKGIRMFLITFPALLFFQAFRAKAMDFS